MIGLTEEHRPYLFVGPKNHTVGVVIARNARVAQAYVKARRWPIRFAGEQVDVEARPRIPVLAIADPVLQPRKEGT